MNAVVVVSGEMMKLHKNERLAGVHYLNSLEVVR